MSIKNCATCAHASTKMAQEPCATCIDDELVRKQPAYGKWEAKETP